MKTASKKAKGSRLEKWVKKFFEDFGFKSRRQPGSGIFADFAHDNHVELPGVGPIIIECKSWKHGWRTGDKAMGDADMLVIKRDFGEPCFYIPERTMVAICNALKELEALKQLPPGTWVHTGPTPEEKLGTTTLPTYEVTCENKQIKKKGFV